MEPKIALVLGATGGIGGEVARRLQACGWTIRALHRHPHQITDRAGLTWIKGDAMSAGDVAKSAQGVSLIVHAVNPPGYRDWDKLVLPMLDNTIEAARAAGARILLPGTVYNYGPDVLPMIDENSPQQPVTRKGKIRSEMERRLKAAAENGSAKVLIVRAGDFFGPRAHNNWFSQGLVKPGRRPRAITYPGRRGVGHQWAYLPDVAKTMVELIEQAELDDFAVYHMEGHWDCDGTQMIGAIHRVLEDSRLPVRGFPWAFMRLSSPIVPLFREFLEMKYLWDQPVRMHNRRLVAALGSEPHTPIDEAIRTTLIGLGCMKAAPRPAITHQPVEVQP